MVRASSSTEQGTPLAMFKMPLAADVAAASDGQVRSVALGDGTVSSSIRRSYKRKVC
jgi:hypothetical protein